jgi:hypothetical protein
VKAPGGGAVPISRLVVLVILGLLALVPAAGMTGCGNSPGTLGTLAATTSTTTGPGSTSGVETTGGTAGQGEAGTTATADTLDPNRPTTTVFTGTTGTDGGHKPYTYVGPVTVATWKALRQLVIHAGDDGQKVLDEVARLSAGPSVNLGTYELDALRGIGYSAGADVSQPIAAATDAGGRQILVFAFRVTGKPESATIVGFDRQTQHVGLVEGPLPISDSTQNITTIPGH